MGSGVLSGFGPSRNPWHLDYSPSGSSSGSGTALAAYLTPLSIGTDTGGSIRAPAAACGIVGLKQTYGRVSRYGVTTLSWTLDHATATKTVSTPP
jgi:aspartyl-tRNA(Asn)/glutamyl-tRNA(Gln) amidotransferase subunit A